VARAPRPGDFDRAPARRVGTPVVVVVVLPLPLPPPVRLGDNERIGVDGDESFVTILLPLPLPLLVNTGGGGMAIAVRGCGEFDRDPGADPGIGNPPNGTTGLADDGNGGRPRSRNRAGDAVRNGGLVVPLPPLLLLLGLPVGTYACNVNNFPTPAARLLELIVELVWVIATGDVADE
jgi:hypothetical protein